MPRPPKFVPRGVAPAVLMAFRDDFSIDEPNARRHLCQVAAVKGLAGITVNAHASEVHALTFAEQQRVLEFSVDEVRGRVPLIQGVYADGSHLAARIARMAEKCGASALLVFPPQSLSLGGQLRPEMALAHFQCVAAATSLPLILFQYPLDTGLGYPLETLVKLCEQVPSICAMKDWCLDAALHERHTRVLQGLPRPVHVLSSNTPWLMASLTMGAHGVLSGAGSVVADLQVELFRAVQAQNLARAQAVNDRLYPLMQAFYAPPFVDMHNRMKECLVLLGRIPKAVVRPPLMKLPEAEIQRLREALREAGLAR